MTNFYSALIPKYYQVKQIKGNEMGEVRGTRGKVEKCIQCFGTQMVE